MDLNSLKDLHDSHNYSSSSLNNNSNTSGTKVTKLNESTVVKAEQKQIKHFKIDDNNVELFKQQMPVKQMIATTSVGSTSKLVKVNVHPHCINSSLDINNSTSSTKITKLNESFSTKLQEQNKTENLKMGDKHDAEISKQQKPVNQIIAATSVINENNIYPHKVSRSLNNSSNTTGKEVTTLNQSALTKVHEQKNTEHQQKVDRNNVEISNSQIPVKRIISTISVNSPTINVSNIHFRNSQSDVSSLLNNNNKKHGIEVTTLNKSTSSKVHEQKKTVNLKIVDKIDADKYQPHEVPVKKIIKTTTFVLNNPQKNQNNLIIRPNNFPLNLEKIAVPKTVMSNVKILPTIMSGQIKKPISIIPSTTHINPKNSIITRIPPKLNSVDIINNKHISTLNPPPRFKIISSNDLKSKMVLVPPKKNKYILTSIENGKITNMRSFIPTSPIIKPLNSIIPVTVVEKFNTIEKSINAIEKPNEKLINTIEKPNKKLINTIEKPNQKLINTIEKPNKKLINTIEKPNEKLINTIKKPNEKLINTIEKPNEKLINTIEKPNEKLINTIEKPNEKLINTIEKPNKKLINTIEKPNEKLINTIEKPNEKLINTIEKPNEKLINTIEKPIDTIKKSINTIEKPISTIIKPNKELINTIEKPIDTIKKSINTIEKPINSIIKPNEELINTNEKLIDTIEKPKIKNIESKFVIRFKEFQNQRYKISPVRKNIYFKKLNKLFESNSCFKLKQQSSENSFIKKLNKKRKSHIDLSNSKVVKIGANTTEFKHNQQAKEPSSNENKNVSDFDTKSESKKHIPHTITSKDVINNHSDVVIVSDQTNKSKINTNVKKELCPIPGFIQLASKPDSLIKTYGQPLSVVKYGNFTTKEQKTIRLIPINSINQPKRILNTIPGDGKHLFIKLLKKADTNSNGTIAKVPTDKILKIIPNKVYTPKNLNINTDDGRKICYKKVSYLDPIRDSNNSTIRRLPSKQTTVKMIMPKHKTSGIHGPFIRCEYEYCDTIAYKPEMVDQMFCSSGCKSLDTKLKLATKKPDSKQPQGITCGTSTSLNDTNILKKPVIDRKMLLAKLRSRINKRKQSLPSLQKENVLECDLDKVEKLNNVSLKMPPPAIPLTVNSSFQKSQNKRKFSKSTSGFANSKQETVNVMSYLQHTDYIPAPKKLFDNPFPYDTNPFKVGQRLEGIDPEHEALFCVMSVVEVCGYRIKLHFDGYSDAYDFWVNANCPDLFYPRWCEENFHTLQPPKNYNRPFKWTEYLKLPGITPAPKWNFPNALNTNRIENHSFYTGAKLEALDKLTRTTSKQLICVATIADVLGSRIRIHFDGWADDFDYWTDITSTNIHPVGWCDKNGRTLCAPKGYDDCKGKQPFSWAKYLSETNSEPVPENAFFRRPLREFTNSMAIEVVDIANPSLIRIAKVVDVKGDELKILYDGFDTIYAYWIEDDSPNIHPLGWCLSTNHPIELFKADAILWSCRVPGCSGKGNIHCSKNTHVFAKECPYEFEWWKKLIFGVTTKPDRIKPEDYLLSSVPSCLDPESTVVPIRSRNKKKSKFNKTKGHNFTNPKRRTNNSSNMSKSMHARTAYKRAVEIMDELEVIKGSNEYTSYGYGSFKRPRLNAWTRHNVLHGIPIFKTTDVRKWPVKEVATFVEIVVSDNYTDGDDPSVRMKISKSFIKQEIDGDVFLMLTQKDLTDILNIPLGPALKLHNAIVVLRQRISAFDVADGSS